MSDQLTPEQQVIQDNVADQKWRLNNLYKIKNAKGIIVPFKMKPSQEELWDNRHYLNIILKDRQRGFSTFIAILILDTSFFNSHQECGIIDITLDDAEKKLAKIQLAYNLLPEELKETNRLVTENKGNLEFENGSMIYVGTSHRGGTLQILHISELGKISARTPDKAREIRTGAMNTLTEGCFIFIESTAEGAMGDFYNFWQDAMKIKRNHGHLTWLDFKPFFFGWWMYDGEDSRNEMNPYGERKKHNKKAIWQENFPLLPKRLFKHQLKAHILLNKWSTLAKKDK